MSNVPHTCKYCEYFDDGGADEFGHSDCLNKLSPRFQTYAHQTCQQWVEVEEFNDE